MANAIDLQQADKICAGHKSGQLRRIYRHDWVVSPSLASVMLPAVLIPAIKILVLSFVGHALLWFRLIVPGTGQAIAWRELAAPLFAAIRSLVAVASLVIYLRSPFIDSPNREDLAPDFGMTVAVAALALAIWFAGLIVAVRQERVRPVL